MQQDKGRTGRRKRTRRERGDAVGEPGASYAYAHLRHPFQPQELFSPEDVARIHDTALKVLQELGIRILLPEARGLLASAGASVDEEMVFIGRDIVAEALKTAPRSITIRARNPAHALRYAPGELIFKPGAGCPYATDLERGRRAGTLRDFEETLKLCQSFDVIHGFGPCVEPQDIPVNLRHYEMTRAQMEFGDKPMFVYARGRRQVQEAFEMIRLGLELDEGSFTSHVWASTVINTNSPRMIDRPMAQGLIDFARAGQMSVVTPFCLAGAMAPITVAGALTLQHAEALAAIALAQLARPGAPVSYGGFGSNVEMKSGAPAFGTPEHVKMQLGSGQLARHVGLPWRSAAGSAANLADTQAATENAMGVWGALMANATMVLHAAGWLEGGLCFGYEKFVTDLDLLQSVAELCRAPDASTEAIGFAALAEVPPGGHFFGSAHTIHRYRTAFYRPLVADLSPHDSWQEQGAHTAAHRATAVWKRVLAEFTPPPGSGDAAERLRGYIDNARKRGGAMPLD